MNRPPSDLQATVSNALTEDIGAGDVSAALIDANRQTTAEVICRESAVICGIPWFDAVFHQLDPETNVKWFVRDGDQVIGNQRLCKLTGATRALLSGERTALNFLQTLSATATIAHQYARRLADSSTVILDTRKTIPGLRSAQKYAVCCGGCTNHRMGLYDAILIKENHIRAAGGIIEAISVAKQSAGDLSIEVEVENLQQLTQALDAGVNRCLLDNMDPTTIAAAVKLTSGRALLEASGDITLKNIDKIAATGVDFISLGALTKHIQAINLSMRIL